MMQKIKLVILVFFIGFMISQGFTEAKVRPKFPCPSVTPSPSVTESANLNNEL